MLFTAKRALYRLVEIPAEVKDYPVEERWVAASADAYADLETRPLA